MSVFSSGRALPALNPLTQALLLALALGVVTPSVRAQDSLPSTT